MSTEHTHPTKTVEQSKWITVGGKKIEVNPEDDAEDKIRESISVSGEKQKNTKHAISVQKEYVKRYDIKKSIFNIRDPVVYDEYKKSGIVSGLDGQNVKVYNGRDIEILNKNVVFKKSELLDDTHWDTMSNAHRLHHIEKTGVDQSYINRDWMEIAPNIRNVIQKIASPAGYDSATSGNSNPIYNPVNTNKTVSQRIKEEEETQREPDTDNDDDDKKNNKKNSTD